MNFIRSFLLTLLTGIILIAWFFPPDPIQAKVDVTALPTAGSLVQHEYKDIVYLGGDAEYEPPKGIADQHVLMHKGTSLFSREKERIWFGKKPGGFGPHPTLILLHGSGRTGEAMIDMWRETAQKKGIVLIAPNSSASKAWSLSEDGPAFLNAVLDQAQDHYRIDRDRVYLMGHSAGGQFAQKLAGQDHQLFKSITSHGAALEPSRMKRASTAVPVSLYVGHRDHLFSPQDMTASATTLAENGHDVTTYLIPNHTHWYYRIGPQIAPHMWEELTKATN